MAGGTARGSGGYCFLGSAWAAKTSNWAADKAGSCIACRLVRLFYFRHHGGLQADCKRTASEAASSSIAGWPMVMVVEGW